MNRGGKKNKKKGGNKEWATFNPHQMPKNNVNLDALYR